MAKKILQIVETAYRATIEEQDDPVLWLATSLRASGLEIDVVLRGAAVNYLVRGQDASGLSFGDKPQTQPPRLIRDLETLVQKGVKIYFIEDDATRRGLDRSELFAAAQPIRERALGELAQSYQQIWQW